MSLQCGIVGLPNVGKSTLFNALTAAKAEAANYPFCTIDPNVGVVTVPDPRLDQIAALFKPERTLPTTMEFLDIAGLVEGASKGEGLGNQFLANIRQTNAIVHVVRCFEDPNVIHVAGSVNPLRDIEIINTELGLADLDTVEKRLKKIEKTAQSSKDPKAQLELATVKTLHTHLAAGNLVITLDLSEAEALIAAELHLLTAKPVLFVCNVGEVIDEATKNYVTQVENFAKANKSQVIQVCSQLEAEISLLENSEKLEFLNSIGAEEPGLNRLIRTSYELLNLITFFTAGPKEVRAWTVPRGAKAPQGAGQIHSDFEKGFIRAETYACKDLFALGSEAAVKEAGKYRLEGKDYTIQDGDMMFFRFNV